MTELIKDFTVIVKILHLLCKKQIGGDVWYVILNDKSYTQAHAVLVKNGVVYDYLYEKSLVDDYPAMFVRFITIKATIEL